MSEQVNKHELGLINYAGTTFVLHSDYAKLEAENAALREALKRIDDCDLLYPWSHVKRIASDALKTAEGV